MGRIFVLGGMKLEHGNLSNLFSFGKFANFLMGLSKKKFTKILYFPTAKGDLDDEYSLFKIFFEKKFNCRVDCLKLYKNASSYSELKKIILSSDIIFVGGGNTLRMMKLWRKKKIDKILKEA